MPPPLCGALCVSLAETSMDKPEAKNKSCLCTSKRLTGLLEKQWEFQTSKNLVARL